VPSLRSSMLTLRGISSLTTGGGKEGSFQGAISK
jgi:hypothetical protein